MGKVLIACEESQVVTKEMRALGVEAYSCDIEPCSLTFCCIYAIIGKTGGSIMAKPKYEINDEKKKCNSCGEIKDVTDFYPYKNGIRGSCKKCCNEKSRNYMQTVTKERRSEWWKRSWGNQEYRQRKYGSAQKRIKNIKQKCVDYLGGKCAVCGYNKCVEALEFHHLDPNTKDLSLNTRGINRRKSFDSQKQELDKCILLCSNCHREKHYNE